MEPSATVNYAHLVKVLPHMQEELTEQVVCEFLDAMVSILKSLSITGQIQTRGLEFKLVLKDKIM